MSLYRKKPDRKKPFVIEAFRWTGGPDQEEDPVWFVEALAAGEVFFNYDEEGTPVLIFPLLEDDVGDEWGPLLEAQPGDWIIKGVSGVIYPCKDSVFVATYDSVHPVESEGVTE